MILTAPAFEDRMTFPVSEVTLVVPPPLVISQFPKVEANLISPIPTFPAIVPPGAKKLIPPNPTFKLTCPATVVMFTVPAPAVANVVIPAPGTIEENKFPVC